jgi:hypothetical protein
VALGFDSVAETPISALPWRLSAGAVPTWHLTSLITTAVSLQSGIQPTLTLVSNMTIRRGT